MYYLIYISSAIGQLDEEALNELQRRASTKNSEIGITGMLLYKGGNFMQMLEGNKEVVEALFLKISQDPLHKDVIKIMSGSIENRNFDKWSMGFCNMEKLDKKPSYDEYINYNLVSKQFNNDASDAYRFMVSFNEWMRK